MMACATIACVVPFSPAGAQSTNTQGALWADQCSTLTSENFSVCCPAEDRVRLIGTDGSDACAVAEKDRELALTRPVVTPVPVTQPVIPVALPQPGVPTPPISGAPPLGTPVVDAPVPGVTQNPTPADDSEALANPGNDKDVGRAGETPGNNEPGSFGDGENGRSDVAGDGGTDGGGSGGNGNVSSGSNGNGNSGSSGNNGNGNGPGGSSGNSGGNGKGRS